MSLQRISVMIRCLTGSWEGDKMAVKTNAEISQTNNSVLRAAHRLMMAFPPEKRPTWEQMPEAIDYMAMYIRNTETVRTAYGSENAER